MSAVCFDVEGAREVALWDEPFELAHGGTIAPLRLAYEWAGPVDAPVVVVLGGISAAAHVAAHEGDPSPGWWDDMVGPGRAIVAWVTGGRWMGCNRRLRGRVPPAIHPSFGQT